MSTKEDLKERASMIQSLRMHPGFQLFRDVLQGAEDGSYTAMMKAKDAHELAKHAGAHFAVAQLRSWAERELAAIDLMLQEVPEQLTSEDL